MNVYQENILDHYRNPRNSGEIENADAVLQATNLSCGDESTFYLKLKNGKVEEVKHHTEGCSIAVASASMLSQALKGKTLVEVSSLPNSAIIDLLGIELSPSRLKCALLPLDAIHRVETNNKV